MLEFYGRIGRALYAVRVLLLGGVVTGAGFFLSAVIDTDAGAQESGLLLPLLACLWCLCMVVFGYGFSGEMPALDPGMGWWRRTLTRMKRALWHLLALVMVGLGLATVLFTLRAITVMRGDFGSP